MSHVKLKLSLFKEVAESIESPQKQGELEGHKYIRITSNGKFSTTEGKIVSFKKVTDIFKEIMGSSEISDKEKMEATLAYKTITDKYAAKEIGIIAKVFSFCYLETKKDTQVSQAYSLFAESHQALELVVSKRLDRLGQLSDKLTDESSIKKEDIQKLTKYLTFYHITVKPDKREYSKAWSKVQQFELILELEQLLPTSSKTAQIKIKKLQADLINDFSLPATYRKTVMNAKALILFNDLIGSLNSLDFKNEPSDSFKKFNQKIEECLKFPLNDEDRKKLSYCKFVLDTFNEPQSISRGIGTINNLIKHVNGKYSLGKPQIKTIKKTKDDPFKQTGVNQLIALLDYPEKIRELGFKVKEIEQLIQDLTDSTRTGEAKKQALVKAGDIQAKLTPPTDVADVELKKIEGVVKSRIVPTPEIKNLKELIDKYIPQKETDLAHTKTITFLKDLERLVLSSLSLTQNLNPEIKNALRLAIHSGTYQNPKPEFTNSYKKEDYCLDLYDNTKILKCDKEALDKISEIIKYLNNYLAENYIFDKKPIK